MSWHDQKLTQILREGGVAVMPTDTIYGIVGSALNQGTVERIYGIRKRAPDKPCIILIGGAESLKDFSITPSPAQAEKIKEYWPGPVSIIFDCADEKFSFLHRGTKSLAFRMPASAELRAFLADTGPLVAPSANTEGQIPAKNIQEARKYFGGEVDFYLDGGEIAGPASKIIKLQTDGAVSIIRE